MAGMNVVGLSYSHSTSLRTRLLHANRDIEFIEMPRVGLKKVRLKCEKMRIGDGSPQFNLPSPVSDVETCFDQSYGLGGVLIEVVI